MVKKKSRVYLWPDEVIQSVLWSTSNWKQNRHYQLQPFTRLPGRPLLGKSVCRSLTERISTAWHREHCNWYLWREASGQGLPSEVQDKDFCMQLQLMPHLARHGGWGLAGTYLESAGKCRPQSHTNTYTCIHICVQQFYSYMNNKSFYKQ